ncbi:MAG: glycerol kinase GlpK [Proteobacteria bacterium]|nr:glycerol kinase GlpK [Pseudomonadota bacterium]
MVGSIILAIDEGTTGATVLLVDMHKPLEPVVVGRCTTDFTQHFPNSGWVEHDLNEIWSAVEHSVIGAFASTKGKWSVNVFDRATSSPVCRAIVWQCRRSSEICAEHRAAGLARDVMRRTGLVLDPYFTGTKISWLMSHNSEAASALKNGTAICGTIDTYLLHRLTGGESFATESSNASRTLLYNLKGHWDPEMLALMKVPSVSSLPEVLPSAGLFGKTKGLGFLPDGIPISGIVGDQQAALAGQVCFTPGEAKCTFGTGAFLLLNTGDKPVFSNSGLLTTVAWNLGGKLTYALEGSSFIAGAAVQFLRDQFGFMEKSSDAERMAESASASPGLYFVPALSGLGAPYWDAEARGAFLGMHRGTSKEELVRAALEGIVFQVTDLAEAMAKDQGGPLKVLRADGGAAANNMLMQFQADLVSVPVDRPKDIETTAVGAALFAALGIGIYKDLGELAASRSSDRVFVPQTRVEDRDLVERQRRGWKKAVAAVQLFGAGG